MKEILIFACISSQKRLLDICNRVILKTNVVCLQSKKTDAFM